jgi:hypothetical protein
MNGSRYWWNKVVGTLTELRRRDARKFVLTPGLMRKKEPAMGWRRTLRIQMSEEPRMR